MARAFSLWKPLGTSKNLIFRKHELAESMGYNTNSVGNGSILRCPIVLKLGDETGGLSQRAIAAGDRRQSYFMDDGLVMEVIWKPGLKGFERVWIVRMGGELLELPGLLPNPLLHAEVSRASLVL